MHYSCTATLSNGQKAGPATIEVEDNKNAAHALAEFHAGISAELKAQKLTDVRVIEASVKQIGTTTGIQIRTPRKRAAKPATAATTA